MTMTISNDSRARVKKVFEPIALGMGRLGLTPDALTVIGFGITVLGAILVAAQAWLAGGIVIFLGGAFDMFDGTLARATGRVSNLGAFMDSVFDRWGEGIVYVGIAYGSVAGGFGGGAVLAAASLASAVMVSYTRAKSEGLGFTAGTGMASIGLAPREIRLVILSIGLIGAGMLGGIQWICDTGFNPPCSTDRSGGAEFLSLALGLIAILATITTVQRILHVRQQSRRQSI
jgi:phosphatidylglycerophosphate synthase